MNSFYLYVKRVCLCVTIWACLLESRTLASNRKYAYTSMYEQASSFGQGICVSAEVQVLQVTSTSGEVQVKTCKGGSLCQIKCSPLQIDQVDTCVHVQNELH